MSGSMQAAWTVCAARREGIFGSHVESNCLSGHKLRRYFAEERRITDL
jgi:hypothetical protein